MSRKLALFLALMLSGLSIGGLAQPAAAQTPLTRAVIQALRNRVRLMQKNRPVRSAQVSDAIAPGDALSTARASLAELRFNDGSLARVGEQAVFRFVPNARTFQLSNGTMLLLIPPGRGPTGVRTPNAAAGIKGSALFVRYIPDTDTTLVGALTNNPQGPMVIYNRDGSQSQGLRAGQLAVVVKNRIENVYDFDLNTFYETSDLVKGLNLTQKDAASPADEAIAAVRAETVEALQAQSPFKEANVIENPTFVRLPPNSVGFPVNNLDRVFNSLDVQRVVEAGEVQSEQTATSSQQNSTVPSRVPPAGGVTPPVTQTSGPAPSAQGPASGNAPSVSPPSLPTPATPLPTTPPAVGQNVSPPVPPVVTPSLPPVVPPVNQTPGGPPSAPLPPVGQPVIVPTLPVVVPPPVPPVVPPSLPPVVPPANQMPGGPPSAPLPPGSGSQNPPPPVLIEPFPGGSVVPIDLTLPATPPAVTLPNGPNLPQSPGPTDPSGSPAPTPGGSPLTDGPSNNPGAGGPDSSPGRGNGAIPARGDTPPGHGTPPGQGGERPNSDNVVNNGSKAN
ncbi:MAG TPA: FecR domain-containing protein [Candidatus Obscuribacterales bacterium]